MAKNSQTPFQPPGTAGGNTSAGLASRFYKTLVVVALTLALLAVVVFSFPINRAVKTQVREQFESAVEIRANLINFTIERFINDTESLGSRTAIRNRLNEYTQGDVDFSELVSFTEPKYRDGAQVLTDLIGARRSLVDGATVTTYGNVQPLDAVPTGETGVHLLPKQTNREKTLIAVVRPVEEQTKTIAYDAALFDGSSLLRDAPTEVRQFSLLTDESITTATSEGVHRVELDNCPFVLEGTANPKVLRAERIQAFTSIAVYTLVLFALTAILFYFTLFRFGKRLIDQLDRSIHEKNIFVRESLHRVKNSFVSIEGLLGLKREAEPNPEAVRALQEAVTVVSSNRVLYEKLLRTDEIQEITARPYLTDLAESALQAFSARQRIQLQLDLDDIPLDSSKAFPLGAILTELLTNAIKYAYPEQEVGVVEISLKHDGSSAVLTVRDNGRGFPEAPDPETTESFGLDLVRSLAQQIEGSAQVETQHGAGTRATVRFPAARRRA